MAKIADGTLRDWNNGETMNESDYEKEREILKTAINDNYDRVIDRYTKAETDTKLDTKRDKSDSYSKTESDDRFTNINEDHKGTWQGYTPSEVAESVVQQNLDNHEADTNVHIQTGEREAWNDVVSQQQLQDTKTTYHDHGVSLIESDTDVPSPLKVEFDGIHRVNYIPNFNSGLWTLHANVTVDSDKQITLNATAELQESKITKIKPSPSTYYLFKANLSDSANSQVFISEHASDGSLIKNHFISGGYVKFVSDSNVSEFRITFRNKSGVTSGTYVFSEPSVNKLTSTQFNEIGVSITETSKPSIQDLYPYVDGIKGIQNPTVKVEGANLNKSFFEWDTVHTNATITSTYELELKATAELQESKTTLKAIPSTTYTVSATLSDMTNSQLFIAEHRKDGTFITNKHLTSSSHTFTTSTSTEELRIVVRNKSGVTSGTYTFSNIMLNLGSTALPFEEYNPSYLYALTTLYGNDNKKDILYQDFSDNGTWKVKREFQPKMTLDGTLNYIHSATKTGYTVIALPLINKAVGMSEIVEKYDGTILAQDVGSDLKADTSESSSDYVWITISDIDATGYDLTTTAGIQAYFADKNYFLLYELADSVTEPIEHEGDLSISGDAQVEVSEGIIVREEVTPKYNSSSKEWLINEKGLTTNAEDSPLKHRTDRIIKIYKNGKPDENWNLLTVGSNGNGAMWANIKESLFDTTATYTVTYEILDKHAFTTNLNEVKATYHNSMKSSFQALNEKVSDIGTTVSVHDRLKANKAQEQWINATLLNGWVNHSTDTPASYYKDEFGVVHLRGKIKTGTIGQVAFILPKGYRPKTYKSMATNSYGSGTWTPSVLDIPHYNGEVNPVIGRNEAFILDGITFRAEQ